MIIQARFKKDLNLQIQLHKLHNSFLNQILLDFKEGKWGFLNRDLPVLRHMSISYITYYFQVAFTFWFLRYVFTLVVFILGIKAPGIRQEYNSRIPIPDEEAPQVS